MVHKDNDTSKYTHGSWAAVRRETGEFARKKDGFWSRGGFFFSACYKVLVDFAAIDGIVECL
jgi:hypothetical protein